MLKKSGKINPAESESTFNINRYIITRILISFLHNWTRERVICDSQLTYSVTEYISLTQPYYILTFLAS